jgi:hypothetical protein
VEVVDLDGRVILEVILNELMCVEWIQPPSVVSVLATGPTVLSVAGSGPAEDGGFLRAIKIPSAHFLRRGSKAVGPMSYIYGM